MIEIKFNGIGERWTACNLQTHVPLISQDPIVLIKKLGYNPWKGIYSIFDLNERRVLH